MAEWLRRLTRNQIGFPCAGSNPAHSEGVLNPRPCAPNAKLCMKHILREPVVSLDALHVATICCELDSSTLPSIIPGLLQNPVPQVRLELTTSACLTACTDYKYGALTDCATGAGVTCLMVQLSTYITVILADSAIL